mgnify:CR=1 FL=1
MRIILCVLSGFLLFTSTVVYSQDDRENSTGVPPGAEKEKGEELTFDIWEYQVDGNSLLDRVVVERAVYNYLGPDKTIQNVEDARKNLEQLYHSKGYGTVLVDIPEQDVREGVVRLKVTEGKVGRIRVTGSRYFSLGRIRSQVPSLQKGETPSLTELQKELVALNQVTPDRKISPVLRPGRLPGTVEVELKVKDQLPVHGSLEVNNQQSPDTSSLRITGTLRYDNLWQKEHSLSFMYQMAPENRDDVEVYSGTYVMRMPDSDNVLALYGVLLSSDVSTVGSVSVIGDGSIYGARYIVPFTPGKDYFHSLTVGVDYKEFNDSTELQGADSFKTPIDYLNWVAEYKGTFVSNSTFTAFNVGSHFGIRGLVNSTREFAEKRGGVDRNGNPARGAAKPNYLYATGGIEHRHKLPWNMGLSVGLDGQLSKSPLISNEQYSAGGYNSVRGYHVAEALGDDGIRGTLELQSPSLSQYLLKEYVQSLYLLTFIDAAKLWVDDTAPGQTGSFELIGTGLGSRLTAFKTLDAALDIAWPLTSVEKVDAGDMRVHFSVKYGF